MSALSDELRAAVAPELDAVAAELRRLQEALAALQASLPPRLASRKEAWEICDVTEATLDRWIRDGDVRVVRRGRRVLVDLSSLKPVSEDDVAAAARAARGGR